MAILGRQITPEDELDLDPGYGMYGSWESSSSIMSISGTRTVVRGSEDGDGNPPPPYVQREREGWEDVDLGVEIGNGDGEGIVGPPPPVYHPLM